MKPKAITSQLALPVLIIGGALLSACGGSSSSSSSNEPSSFGSPDHNPCFISQTNQVNLACYLVPGEPNETPTDHYATYQRNSGKFSVTGVVTYNWSNITPNAAQYEADGEVFYFKWDAAANELTQIDHKGQADEGKLTRPLTPVIDAEEMVTNVEAGNTQTGKLVAFQPRTRTIKIPGATHIIKAHNAIMTVQVAEYGNGSGLVSVEYYAPKVGAVAAFKYLNCPDIANLHITDDVNNYEAHCASGNDRALIRQKEGPNNSNSPEENGNPSDSGNAGTGTATTFANVLGAGDYQLHIGITRAPGLSPNALNENASNVALPASEQEMCNKLKAKAIAIITDGNNYSGATVSCAWATSAMDPYDKQAIINYFPYGQAVFSWTKN